MILKGNFIHAPTLGTMEIYQNSFLVTEGEKVKGIYETLPDQYADIPVTDWGEALIFPAFNDLHLHAPQVINRGIGYDKELLPWLETYTFPAEDKFQDLAFAEQVWKGLLHQLWAVGTLRFAAFATVHKEATWKLMELTEQSGLSALIGKVNMDRNAPEGLLEKTEVSLAETEELICRSRETFAHVGFILTPRFVPSTTEALMEGLGRLGETYNLPVQSHLSENRGEIAWVHELHPEIPTYTQVYERFGLLRKNKTIMAHGIYLSEAELELLRERGVVLAHCPLSNINLSSGIMPLRRYLKTEMRCCVASDVAGGHTTSMARSVTAAVALSKVQHLSCPEQGPVSTPEAFYLATRGSGKFFGDVGAFLPGFDFDALVVQPSSLDEFIQRTPLERLEQFLYDGDDRNIVARYCRGQLVPEPWAE
jgi:guanine deaminase